MGVDASGIAPPRSASATVSSAGAVSTRTSEAEGEVVVELSGCSVVEGVVAAGSGDVTAGSGSGIVMTGGGSGTTAAVGAMKDSGSGCSVGAGMITRGMAATGGGAMGVGLVAGVAATGDGGGGVMVTGAAAAGGAGAGV